MDGVKVVISDGETILESREYPAEEVPQAVIWDGRMPNGRQAAPGEYAVMVFAWDLIGNRGSDAGRIVVPEAEQAPAPALPAQIDPADPLTPAVVELETEAEMEAAAIEAPPWIWPAIAWIGLLAAVGFAKVALALAGGSLLAVIAIGIPLRLSFIAAILLALLAIAGIAGLAGRARSASN